MMRPVPRVAMKPFTLSFVTMSPFARPMRGGHDEHGEHRDRDVRRVAGHHVGGDQAREAHHVGHREVERGAEDDEGLPDGDEAEHAHAGEDVADVAGAEEVAPDGGDEDRADDDDPDQREAHDEAGVEPPTAPRRAGVAVCGHHASSVRVAHRSRRLRGASGRRVRRRRRRGRTRPRMASPTARCSRMPRGRPHRPAACRWRRRASASSLDAGSSAATRPSCMTRMRSDMPMTSGSSEEIMRMATPSLASRRMSGRRRPSRRRRCRGWARRAARRGASWRATSPARPSAGCRPRGTAPPGRRPARRTSSEESTPGSSRRTSAVRRANTQRMTSSALSSTDWFRASPWALRSSVISAMPGLHGLAGAVMCTGSPSSQQLAARERVDAEERLDELGAAAALQAGDPHDLAGSQFQVDAVDVAVAGTAQFEARLAERRCPPRPPGKYVGDGAADHAAHQFVGVELGGRAARHECAVLQHGDGVAEVEDLLEPVRDVEDRDAARLQPAHDRVEQLDLVVGERGGRLVHRMTRASTESAFTISTICCSATVRVRTGASGSMQSMPSWSSSARVSRTMALRSTKPGAPAARGRGTRSARPCARAAG